MKNFLISLIFLGIFAFTITTVISRGFREAQVPNGSKFSCNTCHTNGGGSPRNEFGKLVGTKFLTESGSAGNVVWNPLLASLDADNDGVTNGEELQDPFGQWVKDQANPGDANFVSSPGDLNSTSLLPLTISFSGMNPHIGQMLKLRVIDRTTGKEVGRTTVDTISQSFDVVLDAVLQGRSYYIDMFADHNGNGLYDAPPTDHAWRIELNDAQGNDNVSFSHNTDFVDIEWDYMLTINITGMTPHLGKLLELRVEDDLSSEEVGRIRIESISEADFTVEIPGIKLGKEYKVEFYADHNGNGIYDAPPTDHTWKLQFENSTGDVAVDFAHNTDFKDVGWKYLYSLNLIGMNPHIGQTIEMRIVRQDNGEEVGRTKINSSAGPDFILSVPNIEMDHDYNVDFYADHNSNGQYDAPPTDHAWRITFSSTTGNFVQNFTHNPNFTDVNWINITGILDEIAVLPNSYRLLQNFPNPFNPTTNITFNLKESGLVNLTVFDILGREVTTLVNKVLPSGLHSINFNASELQSGTYIYRIQSNNFTDVRKMVLLK
ncbi:MAG: T9SS type A sorting domain-containing protein [Melioribacteraceae bacterium]